MSRRAWLRWPWRPPFCQCLDATVGDDGSSAASAGPPEPANRSPASNEQTPREDSSPAARSNGCTIADGTDPAGRRPAPLPPSLPRPGSEGPIPVGVGFKPGVRALSGTQLRGAMVFPGRQVSENPVGIDVGITWEYGNRTGFLRDLQESSERMSAA